MHVAVNDLQFIDMCVQLSDMGDAQLQHDARTLKKEEAALRYYMKEHALRMCPAEQKGYADCVRGRTLSVVSLHSRPDQHVSRTIPGTATDPRREAM